MPEKVLKTFKDEVHDEDAYEVDKRGIAVNLTMLSGNINRMWLSHSAIEELYQASQEVKANMTPVL